MAQTANTVQVGPWGGSGGDPWYFQSDDRITGFKIHSGTAIDAIAFKYSKSHQTPTYGGKGGELKDVSFDEDEIITEIRGKVGDYDGHTILRSLTFKTNKSVYGPYGGEDGHEFVMPVVGGKIVGFYGRAGFYLDNIGVVLRP